MYRDPDGRWVESVWDAANVVMGAKSFVSNVSEGNIGGAIIDGFGVVIDVAAVIAGVGFAAKTSSTVIKLIRANRTKITRVVEAKIASMLGKSVASWVGTAISIGLTIGGTSIGDLVARGLDYADGNYDGYVFP